MSDAERRIPIAWWVLPKLAVRTVLAVVAAIGCVTLPFAPGQLGKLCAEALNGHDPSARPSGSLRKAGLGIAVEAVVLGGAVAMAHAIAEAAPPFEAHPIAAHVLLLAVPLVLGAACSPAALAPFAILHSDAPPLEALARSYVLSARRGAVATLGEGAALGGLVGALASVTEPIGALVVGDALGPLLAELLTIVVALPSGVLVLARAYVEGVQRPAFDRTRDLGVVRTIRRSVVMVVPAVLVFAAACAVALVTPTAMYAPPRGLRQRIAPLSVRDGREVAIAGPHGLRVVRVADGLVIETSDGGGAGHVRSGLSSATDDLIVGRVPDAQRDLYAAFLDRGRRVVLFDERGVRVDDDFGDRLGRRLGIEGLCMILLALGLALMLAHRILRALAPAALLDAPTFDVARRSGGVRWALVPARLRLGPHTTVEERGGRAVVAGEARIEHRDGAVVITLPPEVPLVGGAEGPVEDGAEVALVTPITELAPAGLRQGAMPWPEGARLALGSRDFVAELLVRNTMRRVSWVALALACSLLVTAFWIVHRL